MHKLFAHCAARERRVYEQYVASNPARGLDRNGAGVGDADGVEVGIGVGYEAVVIMRITERSCRGIALSYENNLWLCCQPENVARTQDSRPARTR